MNMLVFSLLVMLSSQGGLRDFIDPVGFCTQKKQIEAVIEYSQECDDVERGEEPPPAGVMLAAVCPHDDHIYAGPVYLPVMRRLTAHHLILIGVFHKAWQWHVDDMLIFDDFDSWKGPCGPLPVDAGFRESVMKHLSRTDIVVSNEYHSAEHSLEAFVAFIQHFDPGASILPVLVPYMPWERMDHLARELSKAVSRTMKQKGWQWGKDVQILISNDSVHYGDQGWGGKNHAPFGTGTTGLMDAKQRDMSLIREYLIGPIVPGKMRDFLYRLVDRNDVHQYTIPWCGRFSVPFGLDFTRHLAQELGAAVPRGLLLGYGTSVELGELPVRDLGLGVTAPANLHHWVAYTALGYF